MEKTLVFIKPDGIQRGLVGEIIHRFEIKGLKLTAIKMMTFTDEILDQWYSHLKDRDFYPEIKEYIKWTPVVAMVWEGLDAISTVRNLVGITKAREAEAGSIRGDFGMSQQNNIMHASDSLESAKKEIKLIFKDEEIYSYKSASDYLVYGKREL